MTGIEDELRKAFAEQAAAAPVIPGNSADLVIRRGRQIRRRRLGFGSGVVGAFVMAAAALFVTGVPQPVAAPMRDAVGGPEPFTSPELVPLSARPTSVPETPPATSGGLPFDLVAGSILHTSAGQAMSVPNQGEYERAYRDSTGYLLVEYLKFDGKRRLWHVSKAAGQPIVVVASADRIAVSDDGDRVAWTDGSVMAFRFLGGTTTPSPSAASYGAASVRPSASSAAPTSVFAVGVDVRTRAPDMGAPVGFVGDAVLLAATSSSTGRSRYDLWYPAKGEYRPTWREFLGVYGTRLKGREVVVVRLDPVNGVCVSTVEPVALAVVKSACGVLDLLPQYGSISPNGRWLVVARDDRMQAVDLGVVFDRAIKRDWQLPSAIQSLVWVGDSSVAAPLVGRSVAYVCQLAGGEESLRYTLPGGPVVIVSH